MPTDRRQARILAMQALCQWDVQHDESDAALRGFLAAQQAPARIAAHAGDLVLAYWGQRQETDQRIARASRRWALSRISSVERNILRVAVVELLGAKAPPKVVLNEAIEIGRAFGGKDSPRFINGVLDHVLKESRDEGAGESR